MKVFLSVLCTLAVAVVQEEVTLEADRPFLRGALSQPATLKCCFKGANDHVIWEKHVQTANRTISVYFVKESHFVTVKHIQSSSSTCVTLTIKLVQLNDTGLYRCLLNRTRIYTHGTYLQVFKPMNKTINLKEKTKNKILIAEGILLLLCVLVPSATLLFKSKHQNELEKIKSKREEENIYQGLNLNDCSATYDQIECMPAQGQYQDARHCIEEDIQLEKP